MHSKCWDRVGKIIEKREADDGQSTSFVIRMENGYETIRHRSHLRHNVLKYTKMDETKVKFNLTDTKGNSDLDESAANAKVKGHTVRRRGRPKKEDKNSETVTSDATTQGISSHTRSKDRPACLESAPSPVKSRLKKKRDTRI